MLKLFLKYSCGSRPRYKMTKDAEQGDYVLPKGHAKALLSPAARNPEHHICTSPWLKPQNKNMIPLHPLIVDTQPRTSPKYTPQVGMRVLPSLLPPH